MTGGVRKSGLGKKLLLLGGSVGLTLMVGEGMARLFLPAPLPWRYPQLRYRSDPVLIFGLLPEQSAYTADKPVRINAQGLRGPVFPLAHPEGKTRILFLGDSIVFGYGVADGEDVAARVTRHLAEEEVAAESINTGVPAYNTEQEAAYLESQGIRYHPDWVIVGVCWNDINRSTGAIVSPEGWLGENAGGEQNALVRWKESPSGYRVRNLLKKSRILYAITEGWRSVEGGLFPDDHSRFRADVFEGRESDRVSEGWRRLSTALHSIKELSAGRGFRTLVVAFPSVLSLQRPYPASSYPGRVREAAVKEGLDFLDLEAAFRAARADPSELFIPYDGDHPNPAGHDLAAKEIVKFIMRSGALVGTTDGTKDPRPLEPGPVR